MGGEEESEGRVVTIGWRESNEWRLKKEDKGKEDRGGGGKRKRRSGQKERY